MCEQQLADMVAMNPDNVRVFHTLTRHNAETDGEWTGLTGRISMEMLADCGFPGPNPEKDTLICACGPKGMNEHVANLLGEAGYTKPNEKLSVVWQ